MMISTDQISGSRRRSRYRRNRPWSRAQADSLPPDERRALDFLEAHDRQDSGFASHSIEVGEALNLLAERKSYLKLGLADMEQVCKAFYSIGARQGRDYQLAARMYTLEEVGDTVHSLTGLLVMGEMARVYRDALLEQGSGRTVAVLREARQAAEEGATEEEGLAAMAAELARKKTPLEIELGRMGRAVPQVSRRSRRIGVLLDEGQELDGEHREELAAGVEGVMVDLSALLAKLRQPQAVASDGEDDADDRAASTDDRADDTDDRTANTDDRTANTDDRADLRGCVCGFVETKSEQPVETEDRPCQTTPGPPNKSDTDDRADDTDDRAASTDDRAASTDDRADDTDDRADDFDDRTANTDEALPQQLPVDVAPLVPVMAALRCDLAEAGWRVLAGSLHGVVIGEPQQAHVDRLRGLFVQCAWVSGPPQSLLDHMLGRLLQPLYEDRARFAVRCLFIAGTKAAWDRLTLLLKEKLPAPVKAEVRWWAAQSSPESG